MPISLQYIRDLFERYGWDYYERDDHTLLSGFQGNFKDFIIGARLKNDWLTLTIPDYLPTVPLDKQAEVYRYLLELNAQVFFVKFVLVSKSKITILVNFPLGNKKAEDFELFQISIDVLSFYADDKYPHLYEMITGKQFQTGGENE